MPASAPRPDRRWILVAVLVGIPILVLVVSLAQRTWYPTGDQAQAELRMRSLPEHVPLLGAAGRIQDAELRQGNHPGPLMFWATWPLYLVLGRSAWAFEAATALVNLAWLTLSVWLVQRRAGFARCAWYGATALVLIGGYGLDALSQPWNPWVALLPFTVLLLATWSVLEGDRWAPVLAVAAASYALQGHVGYAPLVLPLAATCLVVPAWRWWRGRSGAPGAGEAGPAAELVPEAEHPDELGGTGGAGAASKLGHGRGGGVGTWAVPLAVSVGIALLAWSGPLWDVLTNTPNNVQKLIANFSDPTDPPIGLAAGLEAVLRSVDPTGAWARGGNAVEGSVLLGALLLGAWGAMAILTAVRRRDRSLSRLDAVLAVVTVLAVVAVSRIFGALYLYVFRWIVAIVALQVFSLGCSISLWVPRPGPQAMRRLGVAALAAMVLLSAATSVRIARQEIPYDQSSRAMAGLAPDVVDALDPDTRYLVRWDDPAYLGGIGFGLILELERQGFDVGADPRFDAAVEPHRIACPGDYDALLTVVTGARNIEEFAAQPGVEQIAAVDPRTDVEAWEATYQELLDVLDGLGRPTTPEGLEAGLNLLLLAPGEPPEVTDLAAELVLDGVPSAVFLQDPAPPELPLQRSALNEPCWR